VSVPSAASAAPPPGFAPLLDGYRTPDGHYDELLDARGRVRGPWASFGRHVPDMSAATLATAQSRVAKQIQESSITHAVYAATDGRLRPWQLDVLPLIVTAAEWAPLADGVAQLARLLNRMTADLYGPRTLLRDGLVPPALVFSHPGFLRACQGTVPAAGIFLQQVAVDLARSLDGSWQIVNVRTQTPAGAGFALENRATLIRMFPEAFRELHVDAVAPYFAALNQTLVRTAPCDEGPPRIVLLTPGPYSGRYFEHAYLARYFGFALVEGADLTVRHDRVFLKTIEGLRQVHAVVRHLADDFCDPLDLRADSALGVPGLVQAWRAGRVLVANAFGASVLESPALRGLLPDVAPAFIGEPLALSVRPVRWAGDRAGGGAAVAEAPVRSSYAPVWHDGRLASHPMLLRVFAVADGDGGYRVMTGGLTRTGGPGQAMVTSGAGGSKDTWVLCEPSIGSRPPEPSLVPQAGRATGGAAGAVSSRAAEHLFWLGRYVERAETAARLLRTALAGLSDPSTPEVPRPFLLRVCRTNGLLERAESIEGDDADPDPDFESDLPAPDLMDRLVDDLFDAESRRSLAFDVRQTVRVAGAIRDRLSSDNWRLLNQLFALVAVRPARRPDCLETLALLERAIVSLVAVAGLEVAHMSRDHGWRFLSIGRHLERLLAMATTFATLTPDEAEDPIVLAWLLDASGSLGTFRARYARQPEWSAVVELLLFDRLSPRSLSFQVGKIASHVPQFPDAAALDILPDLRRLDRVCQEAVGLPDRRAGSPAVASLLAGCQDVAQRVSDSLTARYFSHAYELPHVTTGR
jgi:uncharacterized circularly permuted ATP-grasp superfamily protein/uncharacterized alpha-E superfamily protein